MAHIHIPDDIPVRYLERSKSGNVLPIVLVVIGALGAVGALVTDAHTFRVSWAANWLFFTSIALGAVLLVVATTIVKARWNWSLKRISASFAAYLPFAFLTLLPMLGFREDYFHWITEMSADPILQAKAAYLNVPFLVARNLVGAALLFGLALYVVYLTVRPDLDLARAAAGADEPGRARWRERLAANWMGQEAEEVEKAKRLAAPDARRTLLEAIRRRYAV